MWKFLFYAAIAFVVYRLVRMASVKSNKARIDARAREQSLRDTPASSSSEQKSYGEIRDADYRDIQ